jgi:hypothetical protein
MGSIFLLRAAALAGGLLIAAAACSPGDSSTSDGSGGSGGMALKPSGYSCSGKAVTYKADVAPLLAAHCAGVEGCHVTMHDANAAYKLLVDAVNDECGGDKRDLVMPGKPEESYAISKITDTNVCADSSPMPKPFEAGSPWTKLPDPMIQTIYDWICQGAKND